MHRLDRERLQLNASFRTGLVVQNARRHEFRTRDEVGGQTNLNHRRCLHAQAARVDLGAVGMLAKGGGINTPSRSSRGNEALTFLGRSLSLLTSAATSGTSPGEEWPAERSQLLIQFRIRTVLRGRRSRSQKILHFLRELELFLHGLGGLPFGQQRAGGNHRAGFAARHCLGVEMPDSLVAKAVGVGIARQHVGRDVAR